MCPLDIFKHRKNRSNLLKDCIHHRLPITDTKLIGQDTSGTPTRQTAATEAQACTLWSDPSVQQAVWIYRSRSTALQRLCGKALPSLPNEQTLCSNPNLAHSSHFDYHTRFSFPNLLQDSPRLNSYKHAPILQQSAHLPLLNRKNLYFRVTQVRAELNWGRVTAHHRRQGQPKGITTKPGTSSQDATQDHQTQGCPRGHQQLNTQPIISQCFWDAG